jgi:hypothetical protein
MSKRAISKLKPLLAKLTSKEDKRALSIKDIEAVPNDGTNESNIVRKLMAAYTCTTERDLLSNDNVIKRLGDKVIESEKNRFKLKSSRRNITSGTDTADEYKVLLEWEKVFPTFKTLPVALHIKDHEADLLTYVNLAELIARYPDKKMFSIPMAIAVLDDDKGLHAVGIFVDMRLDKWTIEYFDSGGVAPKAFVIEWMEAQRKLLEKKHKRVVETYVTKNLVHQMTSTECGLHVLIYYRRRIEGIPYQLFRTTKIPDEAAINFRRRIYS